VPKITFVEERRLDTRIAFSLFFVTAVVYGSTMCRTIYTGDDGDFETAMFTLGICHPTGYPLFTLLGKLFLTLLAPVFAEPAVRINFLTVLFGAGAVGFFYRFLAVTVRSRAVAAMMSLVLAFAPTLWQQSLSCEVYSLTCLFLSTILWHTARLLKGENTLLPLVLTYGFALTNNLTLALFLPAFLIVVLWRVGAKALFRPALILAFLAPLAFYAYLPLAANYSPSPHKWGNPNTLLRVYDHVRGSQYSSLMFSKPIAQWPTRIAEYARHYLLPEFGWHFIVFLPLGLWQCWKRQRPLLWVTLWIFWIDVIYAINYDIADVYVYFIPSYVMGALWIGMGVAWATQIGVERAWGLAHADTATRSRQSKLLAVVALAIPLVQMSLHLAPTDKSGNFLEADYARNILKSAPPNAVIFTTSSLTFTLWYEKWVCHNRPDVVAINIDLFLGSIGNNERWNYDQVRSQWATLPSPNGLTARELGNGRYVQRIVRIALSENRPVLFIPDSRSDHLAFDNIAPKNDMFKPFTRLPWGIADRLYEPGTEPSDTELYNTNAALWPQLSFRGVYTGWANNDILQVHIPFRYFYANKALGQLAEKTGHLAEARTYYQDALKLFADPALDKSLARLSPP